MNEDTTPKPESIKIPSPVDVDDEELLDEDPDIFRVPRSGKRQLMPIERLR